MFQTNHSISHARRQNKRLLLVMVMVYLHWFKVYTVQLMVEHQQQEMWWCFVVYKPASNHKGAAKLNCHLRNRGRVCFSLGVWYFSSLRFSPTLSLSPLTGTNWFHFDYLSCCLRLPPLIKSHSTQEKKNLWKDYAISSLAVSSPTLTHIKCFLI